MIHLESWIHARPSNKNFENSMQCLQNLNALGRFPYVCTKIGNFDCRSWLQSIQSAFLAMFVKHISNLDSSNFFSSGFWCFTFSSFNGNSDVFLKSDFGKTSNISLCHQSNMLLEKMDEGWVKISSLENYIIIISIFYIVSSNRRSRCIPL